MKIPLIGVPKHLWSMITGLFSASLGLVVWRLFLLVAIPLAFVYALTVAGPSGAIGIMLTFVATTLFAAYYRRDVIRIAGNLWNAEWGEAKI